MSTPLDLDAIREQLRKACYIELRDVEALISEIEALRKSQRSNELEKTIVQHHDEIISLIAKLEKAKEALLLLRNAETNGSIRCNGVARCKIIREALAELEQP